MAQAPKYRILKGKGDRMTLADGTEVFRIQATRDIPRSRWLRIHKGTIGGFVSGPDVLAQYDSSWIGYDAIVTGDSVIQDEAFVEQGRVHHCTIEGQAYVDLSTDEAYRVENTDMRDRSKISGECYVRGCKLEDDAEICGRSKVENSTLLQNAEIRGFGRDGCHVRGFIIALAVEISGNAQLLGNTMDELHDRPKLRGWMRIGMGAVLKDHRDVLAINSIGSENGTLTVYRTKDRKVLHFTRGCFTGDEKEFRSAIYAAHRSNKHGQRYRQLIDYANSHFGITKPQVKVK